MIFRLSQKLKLEMGLQHRVIITDFDDNLCVEAVEGKIIFPCEYPSPEHSEPEALPV